MWKRKKVFYYRLGSEVKDEQEKMFLIGFINKQILFEHRNFVKQGDRLVMMSLIVGKIEMFMNVFYQHARSHKALYRLGFPGNSQ